MTFTQLLDKHGISWKGHGSHHHCSEGWINFDCPFCSPGLRIYRMGYCIATRQVNCWACGPQRLVQTLSLLTHEGERAVYDAIKFLPQTGPIIAPCNSTYKVPFGVLSLSPKLQHLDYLKSRGFDPVEINRTWDVGAITQDAAEYRWSLFIPVFCRGLKVSWITRSINPNATVRYRNAPLECSSMPIGDVLYGADYVLNSVIIVEGPLDVWRIGKGAVALCGKGLGPARMDFLSRIPNRVICLDNEPEARKRARKICDDLSPFFGGTTNIVLESKDPAEATPEELIRLRSYLK